MITEVTMSDQKNNEEATGKKPAADKVASSRKIKTAISKLARSTSMHPGLVEEKVREFIDNRHRIRAYVRAFYGSSLDKNELDALAHQMSDITYWSSQPFADLFFFCGRLANTATSAEQKKAHKNNIITIEKRDAFRVYLPRDEAAAIANARRTSWCTSSLSNSSYNEKTQAFSETIYYIDILDFSRIPVERHDRFIKRYSGGRIHAELAEFDQSKDFRDQLNNKQIFNREAYLSSAAREYNMFAVVVKPYTMHGVPASLEVFDILNNELTLEWFEGLCANIGVDVGIFVPRDMQTGLSREAPRPA